MCFVLETKLIQLIYQKNLKNQTKTKKTLHQKLHQNQTNQRKKKNQKSKLQASKGLQFIYRHRLSMLI